MDPISLGIAGAAGGAVLGAAGSIFSGEATKSMDSYKAAVAQKNAEYAEQNAKAAMAEGALEAGFAGLQGRQELGHIRTAQAASGLDINQGTGKDVVKSQIAQIQTNENVISYRAARKAYGFDIQAANFKNEAQFDIMSGKNAEIEGFIGAGESLLGGASSVSDKWTKMMTMVG